MIFISYSRKNLDLLKEFRGHLRGIFDERHLKFWTDSEIKAGQKWDQEIKQALKDCKIAVMLISPTFLASEYIRDVEIPILLQRGESGQMELTALYLMDSVVGHADAAFEIKVNGTERSIKLTEYQGLNTPAAPIAKFRGNDREEEYVKAAYKLKELWDRVNESSVPVQKTSRKQLTVALEKYSKDLYQCFGWQGNKEEGRIPWDKRLRTLENWSGHSALSSMTKDFGDRLFDALFGGLGEQSCRELLAKVWDLENANSNASRYPLRLKIYTPDPLLARLPWHRTTWQGQSLVQCGWSFELIPFRPSEGFTSPDVRIKTPLPIQMILPDSGPLSCHAASHYESLAGCLGRIWSDRLFNKPLRRSHWQAVNSIKFGASEPIVYFYGSASTHEDQLTLDFPDEAVDLALFKKSLGSYSPAKIVFLNLCCEAPDRIAESLREFSEGIDLVIVQTFQREQHFEAERAAIDWFDAVLRTATDPVEALNRCGIDSATAWCNYNLWTTEIGEYFQPVRKELAKLLLNRHRQRETISKQSLDSLHDLKTRVIATVACGAASDRLKWFHEQIWTTLRTDLKSHAMVHHTELGFRPGAATMEDIREGLYRAQGEDPRKGLASLFENHLKKARRDLSMLWILHWEPQGAVLGRDFGLSLFQLWEQFCREILPRECPERMRILCLLPLQTEQPQNVKALVKRRPDCFDNLAYRFFELDPLDQVGKYDLAAFLRRPELNCPNELLNKLPDLIFQHSRGAFDESVDLLEEGLSRSWRFLHDRLAEAGTESRPEPPADPNQDIII